jgi:hypothetical protein
MSDNAHVYSRGPGLAGQLCCSTEARQSRARKVSKVRVGPSATVFVQDLNCVLDIIGHRRMGKRKWRPSIGQRLSYSIVAVATRRSV